MKQDFSMKEYICSMKGHLRDALLRFRAGVSWIPRIEHRNEGSGMLGSRLEHVLGIEHGSEACEMLLRNFEHV